MANKKVQRKKKHLALTVSLVGKMIEINRKGLLALVFTVIAVVLQPKTRFISDGLG